MMLSKGRTYDELRIIPKQYMRQIVTLLLFLSSLCGFSQLYVAEGTVFSIPSSESTFSSQESINIINSSVKGQGLLYFNGEVLQHLNSSETVLQIPNLQLKNADLMTIEMVLEIQHTLIIDSGTLTLSKDLYLEDSAALQTFGEAAVLPSTCGQLVYKSQRISNHFPLVVCPSPLLLTFVAPSIHRVKTTEQWPLRFLSNFENVASYYHTPFLSLSTPPPKHSILV